MFGVNIAALLDSLDTVAKETLEEPKESATRIRSKRKQNSQAHPELSAEDDTNVVGLAIEDVNWIALFKLFFVIYYLIT